MYSSADILKLNHYLSIKDSCLFRAHFELVIMPISKAAANLPVESEDLRVKMKNNVVLND